MIYTREQLREELYKIIENTIYIDYEETDAQDMEDCKDKLADFIASLNEPYFHAESVYTEDETK